jgi:hypothetical protein
MRSIKKLCDVELDTGVEVFDAGQRKVFVTLTLRGIRVRGGRQTATKFITWQRLYDAATMQTVDFDAGPRSGRITRGKV